MNPYLAGPQKTDFLEGLTEFLLRFRSMEITLDIWRIRSSFFWRAGYAPIHVCSGIRGLLRRPTHDDQIDPEPKNIMLGINFLRIGLGVYCYD